MPSVLFICTANQFRSPLAAALLADFIRAQNLAEAWKVESAGTWASPGVGAHDLVKQAAQRLGLRGLENHLARTVSRDLLERFDLILVMESGHKESIAVEFPTVARRVKLLSEVANGFGYNIADPMGRNGDPDAVITDLQTLIQKGGDKILDLARANARDHR